MATTMSVPAEPEPVSPSDDPVVRQSEFQLVKWVGAFAATSLLGGMVFLYQTTSDLRVSIEKGFGDLDAKFEREIGAVHERLGRVETRLDGVDRRLDGVDRRLDGVDRRLDGIDRHLDGMDRRLDGMDRRLDGVDKRLDGIDRRLDGVESRLGSVEVVLRGLAEQGSMP